MKTLPGLALLASLIPNLPAQTPTFHNLDYAGQGNIAQVLDLYLPAGNGPFPLMVFIHGGGWMSGDKGDGDAFPLDLNPRGIAVASINYRLTGEAIFRRRYKTAKQPFDFCGPMRRNIRSTLIESAP